MAEVNWLIILITAGLAVILLVSLFDLRLRDVGRMTAKMVPHKRKAFRRIIQVIRFAAALVVGSAIVILIVEFGKN